MKQKLNNDGKVLTDSNANTDASNNPQVNPVSCFWCFNELTHTLFVLLCLTGKQYVSNQNYIPAF